MEFPHRFLILFLFTLMLPLCHCSDPIGSNCNKGFSRGSALQANIDKVLTDLTAKAPLDGFAVASSGKGGDVIYGLAQCRGDVSAVDCAACVADAAKQLPKSCPQQADARIWYDFCFARYGNENFIGQKDTGYAVIYVNVQNATDPEAFDVETGKLMTRVRSAAVVPGRRGFASDRTQFSPYVTIYGLAECTRDLPQLACAQCLSEAVARLPEYCQYRRGCQVHYSSCEARYEIYPFFYPVDPSQTAAAARLAAESKYVKVVLRQKE